ncbi:MAG: hypothetical protein J1E35_05925 [Lachnospiraceae bacterium]|nr:hypothetical protein [Lachnospiraceae bacterium]
MRRIGFCSVLFIIALLCGCKGYEPKMTSETAIEAVLANGQQYLVEEFDEWQSWSNHTAEYQVVELETMLDGDRTKYIWYVSFQNDEGTRSVHFVVEDENQDVLGGWDSVDAVVDYKEEPKAEYEYTAEDMIIRAILYRNLRVSKGENQLIEHSYVYLDNFGLRDARDIRNLLSEQYIPETDNRIPLGQQAWRITFCPHEEEHTIWDIDTRVIVGAESGKVYGFSRCGPGDI